MITIPIHSLFIIGNLILFGILCLNVSTFVSLKRYMDVQYGRYDTLKDSVHQRFEKIQQILRECQLSISDIQMELRIMNTPSQPSE